MACSYSVDRRVHVTTGIYRLQEATFLASMRTPLLLRCHKEIQKTQFDDLKWTVKWTSACMWTGLFPLRESLNSKYRRIMVLMKRHKQGMIYWYLVPIFRCILGCQQRWLVDARSSSNVAQVPRVICELNLLLVFVLALCGNASANPTLLNTIFSPKKSSSDASPQYMHL